VNRVLDEGVLSSNRTGIDALSVFGHQSRYDLSQAFPLLTTKKIHWKSVMGELLWLLSGSTNAKELNDVYGVTIWNAWAKENGDLGPIYGHQWVHWGNQIQTVINSIKSNPYDRGHIVSAWNVADLDRMALRPCHTLFQFYVRDGKLSCHLFQRSADVFLGVPFNIASYALLTNMVAHITNLVPKELIISYGDSHIYMNHIEQMKLQLTRKPKESPQVYITSGITDIDDIKVGDIALIGYDSHPTIKGTAAV
jgi:thymidylate synthase